MLFFIFGHLIVMYRRKNRLNEVEIQLEDVELIMGKDFLRLPVFLNSAFCTKCSGQTSVENFKIYLDDANDIIFDGTCVTCKNNVSRYIETGISGSTEEVARHIRSILLGKIG